MKNLQLTVISFCCILSSIGYSQDTLRSKNVEAILYTGKNPAQPLIVGLGGSEGGNAWATGYWSKTRDNFIKKGYAFLAIGYFGCKTTPKILNKIAIEDIHAAIEIAVKNKNVNPHKIAVLGGSRGADLALLLGSYYGEISCVIGMSSSHAVFPGHTREFSTSCWTFAGQELPFIPVNDESVPFLVKHNLRGAFQAMIKDSTAEQNALISVEKIKGAVLLMSAKDDEIIPAVEMGNKMMERFKKNNFNYVYEHVVYEGSHAEPTRHFEKIIGFLETNFNPTRKNHSK